MNALARTPFSAGLALLASTAAWIPNVHRLVEKPPDPQAVERLAGPALAIWRDGLPDPARATLRAANPEWDLMSRTFTGYALANLALAHPERQAELLPALDAIIDTTLALERDHGAAVFLLPYGSTRPFLMQPARSQFLDGEIALLLAMRRQVEEKPAYALELRARVEAMAARMAASPTLSAESYPDECWTFCNTIALAAIRLADIEDGTDHSALLRGWVAMAKQKLVDPTTGMLVSSYHFDGRWGDGPEGSSIYLSAHMLQLVDHDFARDQYERARHALGFTFVGFRFSREWPHRKDGRVDIDSGLVIPLLDASPGASGMAMVGAQAFGDVDSAASLRASLDFAAFPLDGPQGRSYAASNEVGDAILLYAETLGPAWEHAQRGGAL